MKLLIAYLSFSKSLFPSRKIKLYFLNSSFSKLFVLIVSTLSLIIFFISSYNFSSSLYSLILFLNPPSYTSAPSFFLNLVTESSTSQFLKNINLLISFTSFDTSYSSAVNSPTLFPISNIIISDSLIF